VPGEGFFISRRVQFATLATRYGIPAIYSNREFPEVGGLMSYGTDGLDTWHQVGIYTSRILKGAKPADLPVLQSSKFEFVINLQTEGAPGVGRPNSTKLRAAEVMGGGDARGRLNEPPPPKFSAYGRGRCRAAGHATHCTSASLSDAAGAHHCRLCRWRA